MHSWDGPVGVILVVLVIGCVATVQLLKPAAKSTATGATSVQESSMVGGSTAVVVDETAAEPVAPPVVAPVSAEGQQVLDNIDAVCGVGLYFGQNPDTSISVKQGQQIDIVCKVRSRNAEPIKGLRFYLVDDDNILGWNAAMGQDIRSPQTLAGELARATGSDRDKIRALQQLFGAGVPVLTGSRSLLVVPYQSLIDEASWTGVVPLNLNERFDELYNSVNIRPNLFVRGGGGSQPRTFSGWLRYKDATKKVNDVTLNIGFSAF